MIYLNVFPSFILLLTWFMAHLNGTKASHPTFGPTPLHLLTRSCHVSTPMRKRTASAPFATSALINLRPQACETFASDPFLCRPHLSCLGALTYFISFLLFVVPPSYPIQPSAARSCTFSGRKDLVRPECAHRTSPFRPCRLLLHVWPAAVPVQNPQAPR
jgi:hypothetical protein